MASRHALLQFYSALFIAAALSSFTVVIAEDSSKSEEHAEKDSSVVTGGQEDAKEKRTQEEILFGNQQNKPNGLVDDLMRMSDNVEEEDRNAPDKKSQGDEDHTEDNGVANELGEDKRSQAGNTNDMMMGSGSDNWYSTLPVSPNAMQYLANSPNLKNMPSEDFSNSLYDQEDLYRRKRQLMSHPLPLRKRSLRSSLGQMIQKRGIRLPRRSMRFKRQVDMEDFLNMFGNERYFDDETPIPGRFSGYPETPAPEFRYPYVFQHRDDSILAPANDEENNEAEGMEDIDNLMLLPPNTRYSDSGYSPYGPREDEKEVIQKWLSRHVVPNVFRVSRRSAPFFYPIDYRYVPGYKKRSSFPHGQGRSSFSGEDEADFGKWGHVVQVPEAYASPEDVARLYGLANLMAEGDESEAKMRT